MTFDLPSIRNTESSKFPILCSCIPPLKIRFQIQKLVRKHILDRCNPFHILKEHNSTDLTSQRFEIERSSNPIQPVGIINPSRNCWCISAMQILCNTPIHSAMINSTKFSKDFPEITKFMKLYHKASSSSQLLGDTIQDIRKELYQKVSHSFKKTQSEPADAIEFLNLLLGKYTFGQEFKLSYSPIHLASLLSTSKEKYLFIETTPLPSALNLQELFKPTPYELVGLIFYLASTKHYVASVKVNHTWYKCNDQVITLVDRTDFILRENIVLLVASQKESSPSNY